MSGALYAEPRTRVRAEGCYWYHVMDVPGLGVVDGDWDLRGREDAYLGGVDLAGRRVLEIGPGNGFLTFHMESRGAEVVAVELAPDAQWDIVPHVELDLEQIRADRLAICPTSSDASTSPCWGPCCCTCATRCARSSGARDSLTRS